MEAGRLVGRESELERLTALVEQAREGRGAACCVEGTPGVGKSALLDELARRVDSVLVLRATGVESELDLPFAGLAELLAPLLPGAEALPPAQRAALRGALALDAPAGAERALVLQAVVGLLAAAAERQPLALLVDDVQWLDAPSQEAIAFAARRAERLPVALIAVRSLRGQPFEPWPGVPRIPLGGLDRDDALALARAGGLAPAVAEALVDAVGGNALALVEAPAQLSAAQRDGTAALPDPLPAGERLQRTYATRIAALPPATRDALLLAAASDTGATAPLAAALGALRGGGELATALAPAEDAGLVALDGATIRFAHPLVRSGVYHAATPSARRAAHQALAASGGERERTWHLAVAATAPDEELAAALEALAHDAGGRGAPATAAAVFERAAQLSPDAGRAAARTIAAAAAATIASRPTRARALLDALLLRVDDPLVRADAQFVRGAAMLQDGRPMAAYAMLEEEAEQVAALDPTRAALLLTQASVALMSYGGMERLAELAARARALAPDWVELAPAVLQAEALWGLGERAQAEELLRSCGPALAAADPVGAGHEVLSVAALCMIYMEDYDAADRLLARLVGAARTRGAVSALALPVAVQGALAIRRGAFGDAAACAAEALALAEDGLEGFVLALALTTSAFVEAHRGERAACERHARRVLEISARLELTATLATGEQALGMLELGAGATERAIVHLERAREHTARFGARDPTFMYTTGDLVDAYVRDGRDRDAALLVAELEAAAEQTGGAWSAAAAARGRALLDDESAIDEHLATALAAHRRVAAPFELARTQLSVGERLRRVRRRADARELLAAAHNAFAALGTTPWAERAARELAAAGAPRSGVAWAARDTTHLPAAADGTAPAPGSAARPADGGPLADTGAEAAPPTEPLTARELAVCELVAGGATNREAAAALFLSPRTVEHHLRQAYRKLDVRSRTELAVRWRERA